MLLLVFSVIAMEVSDLLWWLMKAKYEKGTYLPSFFGDERYIDWYIREAGCVILLILMIILVLVLIDVSVDDIYISVNDGMKHEERCYFDMTCAS